MSDDGGTDLEQRVENLEEQNQQLAAQLARYLPDGPSRRDVLKYGATAFAAAGVGSAVTGAATADGHNDNDGQVGTQTNPVDLIADYVEANSVSTAELLNVHDYIVEPSDDLNDIVNNQLSAGESVWIADGTHTVTKSGDSALTITVDDATIKGVGEVKLEDSASGTTGTDSHAVIGIGVAGGASPDGATIDGITVDGNKANNSNPQHAIGIFGATNYTVKNTICRNATDGGIKHTGADPSGDGGEILYNEVHGCLKDGIFLGGELRGVGNYVHDNPNQDAIEPLGDHQTWAQNVVENNGGSAFDCYGVTGVTVQNNLIIVGANGPQTVISFNGPDSSNKARGCIASGNIILGSQYTGAGSTDKPFGGQYQTGCEFSDNVAIGTPVQIQAGGIPVKITDNMFISCGQAFQLTGDGSEITFSGNYSYNHTGTYAVTTQNGTSGLSIEGNHIIGGDSGMRIRGNEHTIKDSRIINGTGFGVLARAGASGVRFIDNEIRGMGNTAFSIWDGDDVELRGNETANNVGDSIELDVTDGGAHGPVRIFDHRSDGDANGIIATESSGSFSRVVIRDNKVSNTAPTYNLSVSGVFFRNGTEFLSASPTASDYIADDIGRKVIDQSTSPSEVYYVYGAGSLDGPV